MSPEPSRWDRGACNGRGDLPFRGDQSTNPGKGASPHGKGWAGRSRSGHQTGLGMIGGAG